MYRHIVLALVLCAASMPAAAQAVYATLSGRVFDPSRAPIPDATVVAVDVATNTPTATVTRADGTFQFTRLTPAVYRLTIEKPGFRQHVHDGIAVTVNEQAAIEAALEIGALEDKVVVEGGTPIVQARSAEVSGGCRESGTPAASRRRPGSRWYPA
jgi:Carboxypeptidase regulatory-like domain